jgi:hypothetical protein
MQTVAQSQRLAKEEEQWVIMQFITSRAILGIAGCCKNKTVIIKFHSDRSVQKLCRCMTAQM